MRAFFLVLVAACALAGCGGRTKPPAAAVHDVMELANGQRMILLQLAQADALLCEVEHGCESMELRTRGRCDIRRYVTLWMRSRVPPAAPRACA